MLNCMLRLCVAATINAAVELTIRWNKIEGLNSFSSSAGQLIPTIIGIGTVLHVVYKFVLSRVKNRANPGFGKIPVQVHKSRGYDIPERSNAIREDTLVFVSRPGGVVDEENGPGG